MPVEPSSMEPSTDGCEAESGAVVVVMDKQQQHSPKLAAFTEQCDPALTLSTPAASEAAMEDTSDGAPSEEVDMVGIADAALQTAGAGESEAETEELSGEEDELRSEGSWKSKLRHPAIQIVSAGRRISLNALFCH